MKKNAQKKSVSVKPVEPVQMPEISFRIKKTDLLAMREMQGEDTTRPAICGVSFEVSPNQVLLVASDGRRLGALLGDISDMEIPLSVVEPIRFTVDYPMIGALAEDRVDKRVRVRFKYTEVEFSNFAGDKITHKTTGHEFPRWRHLSPTTPYANGKFCLNTDFLLRFSKVSKLLWPKDPNHLTLLAHECVDNEYPAYSIFLRDARFYGLLMPVKSHGEPDIPEWAKAKTDPTKAPAARPAPAVPAK